MKKSKDIISLIDIVSDLEQLQKKVKEEIISLQSDKGLMQNDLEHYNKQLLITENNLKAKQEIKSASYARRASKYVSEVTVANIGEGVNTFDSEFSPNIHDSKLYFSSLRADKIAGDQQVNDEIYKIKV